MNKNAKMGLIFVLLGISVFGGYLIGQNHTTTAFVWLLTIPAVFILAGLLTLIANAIE